jgi:hypothetical protein
MYWVLEAHIDIIKEKKNEEYSIVYGKEMPQKWYEIKSIKNIYGCSVIKLEHQNNFINGYDLFNLINKKGQST